MDFEGRKNVFSSYLEMAVKALTSCCLIPRQFPVSTGKRCLVTNFLQHPPAQPPLQLLQSSSSQAHPRLLRGEHAAVTAKILGNTLPSALFCPGQEICASVPF